MSRAYEPVPPGGDKPTHDAAKRTVSVIPRVILEEEAGEAPDQDTLRESRWWPVHAEPEYPFTLDVRVGPLDDGRLACTGLRLNYRGDSATEITARSLREVHLPEILRAAVDRLSEADPSLAKAFLGYELSPATRKTKPRLRPGPPGYDRQFFADVADLYRESLRLNPAHPYDHFRRAWGGVPINISTARRWVQRARDMGLLGNAPAGKAGEVPRASSKKEA